MTTVQMPARESWKNVARGAAVAVAFPIANATLDKSIMRSYPLLDNHLYFISVQLQRMARADQVELVARAADVLAQTDALIATAGEKTRSALAELAAYTSQPAGCRTLSGVKKTPQSTRVINLYQAHDAILLVQNTRWIDGELPDADYQDAVQASARQIRALAAAVSSLFREGLDVANAIKAAKAAEHA